MSLVGVEIVTRGFCVKVIVGTGVSVGRTATIAVGVTVALGAQDASAIINNEDKKIVLRNLIS
jgi:hypothetical protein